MSCPDADSIVAFVEGDLPAAERLAISEHLDGCEECLALVAEAGRSRVGERPPPSGTRRLETGTPIGRYLLLDLVGSGGMGDVYAAYDPKLDRRVAIKLMNDRVASPGLAARFAREAQAVARLSHPNVVAIFDAGEFGDRVYLAMEFVEGSTLASWLGAEPRSWREIRDVFVAAGTGLMAAHEAGLIHRDFKPHNVMVGRDGSVRVMDFGLAADVSDLDDCPPVVGEVDDASHLTAKTLALTRTGVLLGTPLYMAPEQFLGRKTDARTDQFSFCVSLYEAIYGERPFASHSLSALTDAVKSGQVREPTQKARAPSFLRKLLLRGLAADPGARFASMRALLDQLAYDPSRRRRAVAISLSLSVLAVATLAGGHRFATRGQRMCRSGADQLAGIWEVDGSGGRREAIHRAFLATGRSFAEETWTRVSSLLDDYARNWIATYTDTCQATHVRGDQSGEVLDLRMTCLEGPRQAMKALTDVFARTDSAVLVEAVKGARALPALERCADVPALQAVVPPPDKATRAQVSALRIELAEIKARTDTGQWEEARRRSGPLVDRARAVGYQPLLAETLSARGWLEAEAGTLDAAVATFKETLWTALGTREDEIAAQAAGCLIGITGYHLGRQDESGHWEELGEALLRRLGPGHDRTAAWIYQDRAIARERRGDYPGALTDLDTALGLKERALPHDHPDVAESLMTIANVRNELGDHAGALAAASRAVEIFGHSYGAGSPQLAHPLGIRGESYEALGRYAEAESDLQLAVALSGEWVGAEHPWTAYPLTALGSTLTADRRAGEAVPVLEKALRIRERAEPNPDLVAETQFALARARWESGQNRLSARQLAQRARETYAHMPNRGKEVAEIETWLGDR